MAERTEPATPRRLREARERGQIARSEELVAGVLLCGGGVALDWLGPSTLGALERFTARLLVNAPAAPPPPRLVLTAGLEQAGLALGPPLVLLAGLAALVTLVQVGPALSGKALSPRLDRFDPIEGLRRLWSGRALYGLAKSVLVVLAVGALLAQTLGALVPALARLAGAGPARVGALLVEAMARLLVRGGALLIVVGLADLAFQRWRLGRELRMTKEEVKREHREQEGDPRHKAERTRLHRELLAHARIEDVRYADCVVVNPDHIAVALRYDEERMEAPRVLVKGERRIAERILEVARAHGVPVVRDVPLARALIELELDQDIPEELYEAVAEVLRLAYAADRDPTDG